MALGAIALLAWFSLFAAGASIDSAPYRQALAGPGAAGTVDDVAAASSGGTAAAQGTAARLSKWTAFLGVMAFYTPLNVALLTILAGLVGGCASRLTWVRAQENIPHAEKGVRTTSDVFRTEPPVASMLRSFLVYLAFIAGIFITTNDPFKSPTPDQYVRLAGLFSFVSFGVGYDPTRFQSILSLKPGGANKE